ncbi:glycosyltransferase family 4 protein [Novosphingobium flavum]|uniref:Glycosyltransferase family 4 protein n=1 Tax=Novosphingobium flavum TaxID=1778672 RepID=A0A7X1FTU8_9SPHN|nr:glycosyltransferase family 4 protein [Novosphingobium flavum]MBC2666880.1 glycosyltransferase family 4 protein [Novosphingobium flavum]
MDPVEFRPFLLRDREASHQIVSFFPQGREGAGRAAVTAPRRVALIGTFPPRKCGIATFTSDVAEQFARFNPGIALDVYALDNPQAAPADYVGGGGAGVTGLIEQDSAESYAVTARRINESAVDAVWLQHEYGIFGGPDGEMVCDFVDRLAAPLVLTFHTVLSGPSLRQEAIMRHLVTRASRIMVMSGQGRDLLVSRYRARAELIEVIPHGAPDRPFGRSETFKETMGLPGRKVLMTFGLLGPGKGLERVIEALPEIVARHPEVVYRIVGATHPNLIASEGESYREGLMRLAKELGVENHVLWDNRFLDTPELLDQLEACDIYLTPYPGLQQATSGTLSYAVALGKAVVSTPYVHARELLAGDVGVLIEPGSSAAIADAVGRLLDDPARLGAIQRRAYARGRGTIWPEFARAGAALIGRALAPAAREVPITATPGLSGVFAMSDATGMLQHAIGVVPDRRHGYCLDDNARALMLMNVAQGLSRSERMDWAMTYASFVQHAWNPDLGRFRNFMNFDRTWCEDCGSEDSNGRALWALGHTAELSPEPELRRWAARWFDEVCPIFAGVDYPRSVAFALLGAAAMLRVDPGHAGARGLAERGGVLLHALLEASRRPDWGWFEAMLGYDNPRLSQALIEAGMVCGRDEWIAAGIDTLGWIADRQTASAGHFRPIGSETFGRPGEALTFDQMPFDQQPLEAQAAIEAARSAWAARPDRRWSDHAMAAWRWFFGANDRGAVLADLATGRSRDGVTPRGANENCGAESILAFQLAHHSMLALWNAATHAADRSGDTLESGPRSTAGQSAAQPLAHP